MAVPVAGQAVPVDDLPIQAAPAATAAPAAPGNAVPVGDMPTGEPIESGASPSVGAHAGGLASRRNAQAQSGVTPETRANPDPVTGQPRDLMGIAWLGKAAQKIQELKDMTQDEKVEHPIKGALGDAINKIEGLLVGNESHKEDAIGSGKYGMLTNPVTGMLIPGPGEGESLAGLTTEKVGTGIEEGLSSAKNVGEGVAETAPKAAPTSKPGIASQVVKGAESVQKPATETVGKTVGNVAEKAGVEAPKSENVLNRIGETADNIHGQAKGLYSKIDEATGGKFTGNDQLLRNNAKEIQNAASDEELTALKSERAKLLQDQEGMFNEAAKKGVSQDTVAQARATYKHAEALRDLDQEAFMSRVVKATDKTGQSNLVDPQKLLPRLQKMYRSGRLAEAMGGDEHAAVDLLKETSDLARTGERAAHLQRIAGRAALGAAATAGVGWVYHLTR